MLLFFVRHGDPMYNPDSLTPLGARQAEAIGRRLARYGLDRIYASSSNRAMLTAQPACELVKLDKVILDWCNEGHAWQELTVTRGGRMDWVFADPEYCDMFARNDVRMLGREWYDHPLFADHPTFKSGMQRIQQNADAFLAELGYEHDLERNAYRAVRPNGERVALFAHQGFGLAFLSCVLDIPYPMFSTHMDMSHSGMTVIEFPEREGYVYPKALQVANDSHIYADGLPTKYHNAIYF